MATTTNDLAWEPLQLHATLAEGRVAEAWARLETAERAGSTRRVLDRLEAAYLTEVATYRSAVARGATRGQDAS